MFYVLSSPSIIHNKYFFLLFFSPSSGYFMSLYNIDMYWMLLAIHGPSDMHSPFFYNDAIPPF